MAVVIKKSVHLMRGCAIRNLLATVSNEVAASVFRKEENGDIIFHQNVST
jgi:hypothetical protein